MAHFRFERMPPGPPPGTQLPIPAAPEPASRFPLVSLAIPPTQTAPELPLIFFFSVWTQAVQTDLDLDPDQVPVHTPEQWLVLEQLECPGVEEPRAGIWRQDICGILNYSLVRKREKLGNCPVWKRGGDMERRREGVVTDCRTNPHSSRLLKLF